MRLLTASTVAVLALAYAGPAAAQLDPSKDCSLPQNALSASCRTPDGSRSGSNNAGGAGNTGSGTVGSGTGGAASSGANTSGGTTGSIGPSDAGGAGGTGASGAGGATRK